MENITREKKFPLRIFRTSFLSNLFIRAGLVFLFFSLSVLFTAFGLSNGSRCRGTLHRKLSSGQREFEMFVFVSRFPRPLSTFSRNPSRGNDALKCSSFYELGRFFTHPWRRAESTRAMDVARFARDEMKPTTGEHIAVAGNSLFAEEHSPGPRSGALLDSRDITSTGLTRWRAGRP